MTVIRELVASLGIDFDKRGADAAKSSIEGLRKSMGLLQDSKGRWRQANGQFATDAQLAAAGIEKVGGAASKSSSQLGGLLQGLGLFAAWRGFAGLVDEAANADDYMNVLRETFKGSADDVVGWSETTADAMSRSAFEMRKMASTLGAFLVPMLGGNRELAAGMSKTLSELSVDLSSFYADMSDEDAMQKLRSGLSGESEAVKSLGIDLTEAGLAEFARAQGMAKSYKSMTMAEKIQVRFNKIMADTIDKQGDAVRTADSYENRLKALKASFQTLSVAVGGQFVGAIEGMLGGLRGSVQWMQTMVETSNIAKGVFVALGVATAAWGVSLAVANWPLILMAVGLAALALAVDDVLTLFEGGGSVIGDFIDSIAGKKGAHVEVVRDIKDAWAELGPVVKFAAGAASTSLWLMYKSAKAVLDVLTAIGKALGSAGAQLGGDSVLKAAGNFITGHPLDAAGNLIDAAKTQYNGVSNGAYGRVYDDAASAFNKPRNFNPPPALPVVPGRGAFDTLKGAGIAGDNVATPGSSGGNYTINLYGPQTRESMDVVERSARRLAESTRVR